MNELTYEVSMALRGQVLCVTLGGEHSYEAELAHQRRLAEGVRANAVGGLMLDYRPCRIAHELEQYGRIADSYHDVLPAGFPVAFIFSARQAEPILLMTRRLEAENRPVSGFSSVRPGMDWLDSQLGAAEPLLGATG